MRRRGWLQIPIPFVGSEAEATYGLPETICWTQKLKPLVASPRPFL